MQSDAVEPMRVKLSLEPLPDTAKEVLALLGTERGRAYDYSGILQGVITARGTRGSLPWSPFHSGAYDLGTTLERLSESGVIVRRNVGRRSWFFLPCEQVEGALLTIPRMLPLSVGSEQFDSERRGSRRRGRIRHRVRGEP